jgi:two-component system sensor histidine kinase VicK
VSSFSVPFQFIATFLVAVGAYAGVWLAISRPELSPSGGGRTLFGLGWALLAVAETLYGAQLVTDATAAVLVILRSVGFLLLLVSLVEHQDAGATGPPAPGATGAGGEAAGTSPPAGGGMWVITAGGFARVAGPAVLGLGAALAAVRVKIDGGRRLALGLGLLGAAEVFYAHGGGAPSSTDAVWWVGHSLELAAGLALGWWLWKAFRVSIQARFVAALVLLLVLVIALISSTVTQVFANSTRANGLKATADAATFEQTQLGTTGQAFLAGTRLLGYLYGAQVQAKSTSLFSIAEQAQVGGGEDLVGFFARSVTPGGTVSGQIIGFSALNVSGQPNLTAAEAFILAGSPEVVKALNGQGTYSVDDLGTTQTVLALLAVYPVCAGACTAGSVPVGAVAIGDLVNTHLLSTLPLPGAFRTTVVGSDGVVLGSTQPGGGEIVSRAVAPIRQTVLQRSQRLQLVSSRGQTSYYVAASPVLGPTPSGGTRTVGALLVTEPTTPSTTQRTESTTLFLGALAATLFAVGASMVSGSRITRPIRDLTAAAERVRSGDLATQVPVGEADEVGTLAEAFNQMIASLGSAAEDLREAASAEARLRDQLEAILQSMTDGLIAVDRAGLVVTINREAERIVSMPAERARGRHIEDVLILVDSSGLSVDLPVYRLSRGSTAGFVAPVSRGAQGAPVAVTSAPILDEHGDPSGAVAILRDLSSEMQVEQMKTEFLSNISHELRTPLTPIKGYADLLRRKVVPRDKLVSFLNVIVASTERMERIVDMLVDFSAMQAGRLLVRPTSFNLDQATSELVHKWQEAAPNHRFDRTGFEQLPAVAGDLRLLKRAIDELIDNAVKFSPDGGPVDVHGEIDPNQPDMVRVSVTDQGIGISNEEMNRIFQDFVQLDASETRAFGGLGLGLAYVRQIIEAHNGELAVESQAGEGSRFTLIIPVWGSGGDGRGRGRRPDGPVTVTPPRGGPWRGGYSPRRPPPEWPGGR